MSLYCHWEPVIVYSCPSNSKIQYLPQKFYKFYNRIYLGKNIPQADHQSQTFQGSAGRRRSGEQKKGFQGLYVTIVLQRKGCQISFFCVFSLIRLMPRIACWETHVFWLAWDHWLNSHPAFVCFGGQWINGWFTNGAFSGERWYGP